MLNIKGAKEIKVELTLTEEALGMMPSNKEIHSTYIASNAPDAPTMNTNSPLSMLRDT